MANQLLDKVNFSVSGKYIVAVSGGVDSMSLLDMLVKHGGYELVVAHYDHGIRADSVQDLELVRRVTKEHGLEFVSSQGALGSDASEGTARQKRYGFLESVRKQHDALAIITAHHLDDRIETMLLNQQRGSGWRGLTPLRETKIIKRPLLAVWKHELVQYAKDQNLTWREDSTNQLTDTPRNHIRKQLTQNPEQKAKLYVELKQHDTYRDKRELEIASLMNDVVTAEAKKQVIDRSRYLMLRREDQRDLIYLLLHEQHMLEVSRGLINRLEHFVKTGLVGKKLPLGAHSIATSGQEIVALERL